MKVKFDQHFLENEEILDKIVEASEINNKDIILEIGPGKGTLTKHILKQNPKKIIVIEKDKSLRKLDFNKNIYQIYGNGLEEIEHHKFTKLISNIPYSITEPLYIKILELKIPFIVMLHGNDFYKNLTQRLTQWNYYVNAFYNITLIQEVEGKEFTPPTKVKSVIIKLELKTNLTEKDLLTQNLFEKKDRSVKNAIIFALVDGLKISKKEAKQKVKEINLEKIQETKLKNLSNSEFQEIIEKLI